MNELKIIENGLVPVYITSTGEKVVDGRKLWEALKAKTDFSTWIKRRFSECDAVENQEYTSFLKNGEREIGGTTSIEYIIKLAIAKEMAMLERNEVGKSVRKYFIKVEEKYQEKKKINTSDDKSLDREIRLKNARVREANLLFKIANADDTEPTYRKILKAKAVEVVAGERLLPYPPVVEKTYTAAEVAEMYGISSANMVGKICNKLNLKAPEGESNEYGRWIHSKSQHSVKEVKQWLYTELGAQTIGDYHCNKAV